VTTPSSPHPLENEEHGLSPFPMVFQASSFSLGLNSTKVYGGQESTPYSLVLRVHALLLGVHCNPYLSSFFWKSECSVLNILYIYIYI
jgi:hypothetical protein